MLSHTLPLTESTPSSTASTATPACNVMLLAGQPERFGAAFTFAEALTKLLLAGFGSVNRNGTHSDCIGHTVSA